MSNYEACHFTDDIRAPPPKNEVKNAVLHHTSSSSCLGYTWGRNHCSVSPSSQVPAHTKDSPSYRSPHTVSAYGKSSVSRLCSHALCQASQNGSNHRGHPGRAGTVVASSQHPNLRPGTCTTTLYLGVSQSVIVYLRRERARCSLADAKALENVCTAACKPATSTQQKQPCRHTQCRDGVGCKPADQPSR